MKFILYNIQAFYLNILIEIFQKIFGKQEHYEHKLLQCFMILF